MNSKRWTMGAACTLACGLAAAGGPALAQKVYVQYDKQYPTNGVKTFAWKESAETSLAGSNPLLHSRIVNGIEYYLVLAGAHEVEDDPQVFVTYHTSTEKQVSLETTSFGYGYPGAWGHYGRPYGYGTAVTAVNTYDVGTLVVDIWDAASNKLVWRGTAPNITITDNPDKMGKKVDKALKKLVDTWQKIKADSGS